MGTLIAFVGKTFPLLDLQGYIFDSLRDFIGFPKSGLLIFPYAEYNLHPYYQRLHMKALITTLKLEPGLSAILFTDSPYIIDNLELNQVLVHNKGVIRFLSSHPDADRFKGILTTGKFWDAVGEDWVE